MIALGDKILILDGAMGTMIQKYGLTEGDYRSGPFSECMKELKGNNECLNLTRPEIIRQIHKEYIAAGADIIETCTFNANAISQSEYGCEHLCAEINRSAAQLAREVADRFSTPGKPRFVAGSVGPTGKTLSMSPDVANPAYRDFIMVCYTGVAGYPELSWEKCRPIPETDGWFENIWYDCRNGKIYN